PDQAKNEIGAIMARSTTTSNYSATTQIDVKTLPNGTIAGISAYGDNENALGFGVQNGKLVVWKRERNNQQTISSTDAPKSARLYLKMTARAGHLFRFSVSRDGKSWQNIGEEVDGAFLPPWDRGVRVALTAGGAENASARYGFLRIEPTKQMENNK
ncbi:MAG: xylosidase, partial [Acidobacteriota bacterium]|nr:xylosidase [Acidobacteriota bacterium]